jgi:PadR family transcriptional regulator
MRSSQLLKGVLELAVLAALADRRSYGLELVERLRDAGLVALADASVYGVLHRLESDGMLGAMLEPSSSGPARKYYELTVPGRDALVAHSLEWRDLAAALDGLLAGVTDGRTLHLTDDHTTRGVSR